TLAQGVIFALEEVHVAPGEDVASIGVLGDEPESLLLARAAYHDGWVWALERVGRVERLSELVVLAVECARFLRPHHVGDLEHFFQPLEALLDRWEGHTQPGMLFVVPGRAHAEVRAPA